MAIALTLFAYHLTTKSGWGVENIMESGMNGLPQNVLLNFRWEFPKFSVKW